MNEMLRIPLDQIRVNPESLRQVDEQNPQFKELVDSVSKTLENGKPQGVLQSILVRELKDENGDTVYGLIDGLQRYTAAKLTGLDTVPARITEMNDAEEMETQIIMNAVRVDTKPAEFANHIHRLLSMNPLMTINDLAGRLNKSPEWVNSVLKLVNLDAEIAKLVDNGEICLANAVALSKLPKDEQPDNIEAAISMNSAEFLPRMMERVKEIKKAKREGRDPGPKEFTPVAHVRKIGELKREMEDSKIGPALVSQFNITDPVEAFAMCLKWVMNLDPISVEAAKQKHDARKAAVEQKRAEAKAERTRKAAEAAAKAEAEAKEKAEKAKAEANA